MKEQTIVLGGGCFWCIEGIFQEVDGVLSVKSGYSGGLIPDPSYQAVCSGTTGHAEVVQISYDADVISLENLLLIHMVTHNPTTLNQQGADKGPQYRSVIFYKDEAEKNIAEKIIAEVQTAYDDKIVTTLEPTAEFYAAEESHQNYYLKNPNAGYCQAVIEPKLAKFRKIYQQLKVNSAKF